MAMCGRLDACFNLVCTNSPGVSISLALVDLAPLLELVPFPLVHVVHLFPINDMRPLCKRVVQHPVLHTPGTQEPVDKEIVSYCKQTSADRTCYHLLPCVIVQMDTTGMCNDR